MDGTFPETHSPKQVKSKWEQLATFDSSQDLNFAPAGKDENPHQPMSPGGRHIPLFPTPPVFHPTQKKSRFNGSLYQSIHRAESWFNFKAWKPSDDFTMSAPKKRKCMYISLSAIILAVTIGVIFGVKARRGQSGVEQVVGTASVRVLGSTALAFNDDIQVEIRSTNPKTSYYLGIFEQGKRPGSTFTVSDTKPIMWYQLCNEDRSCEVEAVLTFNRRTDWVTEYTFEWPLCDGQWVACLIDQESLSNLGCSDQFEVQGGNCEGVCKPAIAGFTPLNHLNPTPMSPVSKIAFGSCFEPESQENSKLWDHMRNVFKPDLWVWLGDNMYGDGEDMENKRLAYNRAKDDQFYKGSGPLAEPLIPVTGTWDDHDSGNDNSGAEYQCHKLSQDEFVYFFDLPETDMRHPSQGENQQKGVYSSIMFSRPDAPDEVGVHLILLDVRTFRSPTFPEKGYCEGAASTMLGEKQWAWLQVELRKPSKVKVIGTGMQVMQPTDQQVSDVGSYCANDGASFFDAINVVGEDARWLGTQFEGWNQIPQEKAKLLQLLQSCINEKNTNRVVLISGDMQWGEMMAKRMPDSDLYGPSLVLYEVTSSGIEKNWPYPDPNANRMRARTCDTTGDGIFQRECILPFIYEGVTYDDCTTDNDDNLWCATFVDSVGNYFPGEWGYCLPETDELVPKSNMTTSNENTCGESFHICNARANYGGIEIDWAGNSITMSIFTPHSNNSVAAQVTIGM